MLYFKCVLLYGKSDWLGILSFQFTSVSLQFPLSFTAVWRINGECLQISWCLPCKLQETVVSSDQSKELFGATDFHLMTASNLQKPLASQLGLHMFPSNQKNWTFKLWKTETKFWEIILESWLTRSNVYSCVSD